MSASGSSGPVDVAVVGAGIVGLATARALATRFVGRVVVLETEGTVAAHQTGHNSGVLHSGLYYKPGSQKARLCTAGRLAMVAYCEEKGVPHDVCGKVVVATTAEEIPRLDDLEARGRANGLDGLRRLSAEEIAEHEPHVKGVAGLFVPTTGIVDYVAVARAFADDVTREGGEVRHGVRVLRVERRADGLLLDTSAGPVVARHLVGCAGLQSDRLARASGLDPGVAIVPFRGEYYELSERGRKLVRNLVYPVPDPAYPFLGVHFTRKLSGAVEAGPNAVLALAREGYSRTALDVRDAIAIATTPGFVAFARKHARTGLAEVVRSFSRARFVEALAALVPAIGLDDVAPGGSGIRAQAMDPSGKLVDDFHFVEAERMVHVLNAPSPAATASIEIGRTIAEVAARRFDLASKR
jgi:L-2-hydroxyglutarate oxidase